MKRCAKCGESKEECEFRSASRGRGLYSYCRKCCRLIAMDRYWKRHDEELARMAVYRDKNRKEIAARCARYYAANRDERKRDSQQRHDANPQYIRDWRKEESRGLRDSYLRRLLAAAIGCSSSVSIPAEMIEAKRELLRVERLLKEKRNGKNTRA